MGKNSGAKGRIHETMKRYTEAGLAALLVLTLGLAGASGAFSGSAKDSEIDSSVAENSSTGTVVDDAGEVGETEQKGNVSETAAGGQYSIMGETSVTVQEMVDYFNKSGYSYPSEVLSTGGAESIEIFCQMYSEEADAEGVRAEVAFAQTMKETGFLQYGGDASIEQFNFAGIGTTGGGVPGNSYPDVRTGIRAQIQHLKAYATADPLLQECVDDRYELVKKGIAPYVQWLGQQENPEGAGWATGENYGYDIVEMIENMKQ